MLQLAELVMQAYWVRAVLGIALITVIVIVYQLPRVYELALIGTLLVLVITCLSDLILGMIHSSAWIIGGAAAIGLLIKGYIDECTQLGHDLAELRAERRMRLEYLERMQQALEEEELSNMMTVESEEEVEDDDDDEWSKHEL